MENRKIFIDMEIENSFKSSTETDIDAKSTDLYALSRFDGKSKKLRNLSKYSEREIKQRHFTKNESPESSFRVKHYNA